MSQHAVEPRALVDLKNRAEAAIDGLPFMRSMPHDWSAERLRRELTVCQVALEMQHEELRKARREAERAEARFRQITEHVEDALILIDRATHRISYASPAFEAIWGRTTVELYEQGGEWPGWTHPDDHGRVAEAYANFIKGDPLDEEYRICRPDGEVRLVRARAFPIAEEDGAVRSAVGLVQDITSEREIEEELRQAQKMETVGSLTSAVAHDFNNVLQAILGCMNCALSSDVTSERARGFILRAASAAESGGELAGQLMAFARSGKPESRPTEVDVVIAELSSLLERLVTERIHLEIETAAAGSTIVASSIQLEQILINLVANARDAMPDGGTLSLRTRQVAGEHDHGLEPGVRYIRLEVEDTGEGMDAHTRARMFEPFFTTKAPGKGTGLGLSTVLMVTKQLGGQVRVESERGLGTRFTFHFPCCDAQTGSATSEPADGVRLTGTVLLVEDAPLVRLTVRHHLEEIGFTVLEADGVDVARRLHEAHPVDLLVADIVMPVMSGPRLAGLLRERQPALPVLLMSASPDCPPDLCAPVLTKPFRKEQLAAKLQNLMATRSSTASVTEVTLPRKAARRPPPKHAARPSDLRTRKSILVVEDDETCREALGELLEAQGYRALLAPSAAEALSFADDHALPLDLLLSDVRLPEMGGAELARRLRSMHPDLLVVFMSGFPESPAGADAFVRKPVGFDRLVRVIEATLAPRGASPNGRLEIEAATG